MTPCIWAANCRVRVYRVISKTPSHVQHFPHRLMNAHVLTVCEVELYALQRLSADFLQRQPFLRSATLYPDNDSCYRNWTGHNGPGHMNVFSDSVTRLVHRRAAQNVSPHLGPLGRAHAHGGATELRGPISTTFTLSPWLHLNSTSITSIAPHIICHPHSTLELLFLKTAQRLRSSVSPSTPPPSPPLLF